MIGVPKGLWQQYFDIAKWEVHPMHPSHFKGGTRREMTRLIEETKWKHPIRALLQIFRKHSNG